VLEFEFARTLGNGAAVRAAAVGLANPGHLRRACRQTLVVCLPSHDTTVAISAACSVAAAVARALVARTLDEVIAAALAGARLGERLGRRHGRIVPGPSYVARLRLALEIAARARDDRDFMTQVESVVGNSLLASESVPAAIALVLYADGDPTRTLRIAASMGNDTDSIATIAGAVVGALRGGRALPMRLLASFVEANRADFDLASLAQALTDVAFPQRAGDAADPAERSQGGLTDKPCRAVCAVPLRREICSGE
jgi:ADP-ribosylglycohydrolase